MDTCSTTPARSMLSQPSSQQAAPCASPSSVRVCHGLGPQCALEPVLAASGEAD